MSIRMSGMVSGLDTDSIVKELVSAYSLKKENIEKAQTKLSWKQDAWKELNAKIYKLYSGTLANMKYSSAYNTKSTTVSDETKASVTAGTGTPNGTQTLEIRKLAKAGYLTGEKLTIGDGSTQVSGTTTLSELGISASADINMKVGGTDTPISLTPEMTVSDLIASLKSAGVNANFDTANQRIFVSSKECGAANNFTLSAADEDVLKSLGLSTDVGETAVKIDGADAEIVLNDAVFISASNILTVNGLTITAKQETAGKITINTTTDTQGIYDKIKTFFKEYNTLINEMDILYNADSARGYEPLTDEEKEAMSETEIEKWDEKIKASLLRRDGTLNTVAASMRRTMTKTYTVNGSSYNLASFGISTLSYFTAADNERNAYHINGDKDDTATSGGTDKLMAAINTDPEGVSGFFTQLTSELYNKIGDKMKSSSLNSAYKVYNDKKLASEYEDYDDQIDKWEDKIAEMEERYFAKFTAMETALAKLESSTSAIASLLGNS